MTRTHRRCSGQAAFTLAEILAALGVIAALAAILTPVYFSARERSRRASCLSSLRQIGLALRQYAQNHDDTYPPPAHATFVDENAPGGLTWPHLIAPYATASSMRPCPRREAPGRLATMHPLDTLGYALNKNLSTWQKVSSAGAETMEGRPEFAVRYSALTVTALDARVGIFAIGSPDLEAYIKTGRVEMTFADELYTEGNQGEGGKRHGGGANYAFADGHAAWMRHRQLRVARRGDGKTPGFGL